MDKSKAYTKDDKLLMYRMNQEHVPLKKQAEITGRTYTAIIQFRNKYGLVFPEPMNNKQWQEAEELWKKGYNYSAIARKFNVSSSYVSKHFQSRPSVNKGKSFWTKQKMQELKNIILSDDVKTMKEVSKRFNKRIGAITAKMLCDYGFTDIWHLKYIFLLEKYNNIQPKSVDF